MVWRKKLLLRDIFIFWGELSVAGDNRSSHNIPNLGPLHLVERLRGVVPHNVLNVGTKEVTKEVCCFPD